MTTVSEGRLATQVLLEERILLYKTKPMYKLMTTISEGRLAAQVLLEERILLYKTKPTYKLMTTILLMLQLQQWRF